jgi:hypothetical protein
MECTNSYTAYVKITGLTQSSKSRYLKVITAVLLGSSLLACDAMSLVIYRRFEDRYASFFRLNGQEYSIILGNLKTSDEYNKDF